MLNVQAFVDALPMIAKGIGGVFVVIAIVYVMIVLLVKIFKEKRERP